ncbi:MAG: stage II sporulation protein M [Myxococcota bacterium]
MDYARFVETRAPEWAAMEDLTDRAAREGLGALDYDALEGLAARHRRVVADFARARAAFPGTEAERRLRRVAFAGHRLLAAAEPPVGDRVGRFFGRDYPRLFRAALPSLRDAIALFALGTVAGLVLATVEEGVAARFVGEEGLAGLREGHIWTDALEESTTGSLLSTQIFTNNIAVALGAWAGGLLFGAGTVGMLLYNGMMLGSVVAVCARYGLVDRLLAFVSAHGVLELFLLTVAGAAGLELARGTLVRRDRTRGAELAEAARRSIALVGGTLPWFVLLGLVEGFLSPLMDIGTSVKGLLGVLLLLAFLAVNLRRVP